MPNKRAHACDVLVLGGHPSAYLAAALLRAKSNLKVTHATIPGEPHPHRLVLVNPALFSLHKILAPVEKKLQACNIHGLRFLADDADTSSEYRSKTMLGQVLPYPDVRQALADLAKEHGVELLDPKHLDILHLDETGIDVHLDDTPIRAKAMILAGALSRAHLQMLNLANDWEPNVMHRHTFTVLNTSVIDQLGPRPTMPMSLDLKGTLSWAWMLPGEQLTQISVSQPIDSLRQTPAIDLLRHWANVLCSHSVLPDPPQLNNGNVQFLDIPLAGALAHEGVGNRTLLIGPAGGFYSACSEDIYPNCWSAVYAVEVMKKALPEKHLQDALNAYRSTWRTTLGDYLRGPQQNLRFLLPLVYRNQVMTTRLTESILLGKSVVR
jgi:flavin-dependent dehydrogenase